MEVELLVPGDGRWEALLRRTRHDIYHLPAYVKTSATVDAGEPRALLVENETCAMLLPIVTRDIPNGAGLWDATSPYGYPGPIVAGPEAVAQEFVTQAFDALRVPLRDLGCVSLFARLHPLLGGIPRPMGGLVVEHGETVLIDLRQSEEEIWRDTRPSHRRDIQRAARSGYRVVVDQELRHLDRFIGLYQATMRRAGANSYYFFERPYFLALREGLGSCLQLVIVTFDDVVVAAGMFTEACGIVEYHLSASDPDYARIGPTKLMLHHATRWAQERGHAVLHLGGGVGGGSDSLFAFKAGFSGARARFRTLRMVVDQQSFGALCAGRESADDREPTTLAGYFPAYRAPQSDM